jgi:hypothetical protein
MPSQEAGEPPQGRLLHDQASLRDPRKLVAIALAIQPPRPLLAELVVGNPPLAMIRGAVAAREACGHHAHLSAHAAVAGVADGQLEARDVEINRLAADCLAKLIARERDGLGKRACGRERKPHGNHECSDFHRFPFLLLWN